MPLPPYQAPPGWGGWGVQAHPPGAPEPGAVLTSPLGASEGWAAAANRLCFCRTEGAERARRRDGPFPLPGSFRAAERAPEPVPLLPFLLLTALRTLPTLKTAYENEPFHNGRAEL